MKPSRTKERDLKEPKVLSSREQAKLDKEKLSNEPTRLDEMIKAIECDKVKTKGMCEFGKHNPNYNKYNI